MLKIKDSKIEDGVYSLLFTSKTRPELMRSAYILASSKKQAKQKARKSDLIKKLFKAERNLKWKLNSKNIKYSFSRNISKDLKHEFFPEDVLLLDKTPFFSFF
jgi:hypothetical protein